jgi:Zn-dependent protease with chaperone function
MQILVVVSLLIVLLPAELLWEVPQWPSWLPPLAAGVYVAVAAGLAMLRVRSVRRKLRSRGADAAQCVSLRLGRLQAFWLLGGLAALVFAVGFGHWVFERGGLAAVPLIRHAVVWLPFALAAVLGWWLEYPAAAALRAGTSANVARWDRRGYVAFQLRHSLLFAAVPIGLIVLCMDLLEIYLYPVLPAVLAEWVLLGGTLLSAGTVFYLAPLLVVRIWRTEPLPPGPLRDELESMCRRLGLRFRRILVWKSGGVLANAGVMGLSPGVRYLLISDGLLAHAPREQILAVFAHEARHVLEHHILYSMLFALAASMGTTALAELLGRAAGAPGWAIQAAALGALACVWFWGFGWLSRRFERQCDVYAAWLISRELFNGDSEEREFPSDRIEPAGAEIFAAALRRIAALNGLPTGKWNWRHGSIAWRIDHLLRLAGRGGTTRPIDRTVRRIRRGLWCAVAAAATLMVLQVMLHGFVPETL